MILHMDFGVLPFFIVWSPFILGKLGVRWSFKVWAWIYGVFFLVIWMGQVFFNTMITIKTEKLTSEPVEVAMAFDRAGRGISRYTYHEYVFASNDDALEQDSFVVRTRNGIQYGIFDTGITLYWVGSVKIDVTIDGPGGSCHKSFVSYEQYTSNTSCPVKKALLIRNLFLSRATNRSTNAGLANNSLHQKNIPSSFKTRGDVYA